MSNSTKRIVMAIVFTITCPQDHPKGHAIWEYLWPPSFIKQWPNS